jgi:hypothetical protein
VFDSEDVEDNDYVFLLNFTIQLPSLPLKYSFALQTRHLNKSAISGHKAKKVPHRKELVT